MRAGARLHRGLALVLWGLAVGCAGAPAPAPGGPAGAGPRVVVSLTDLHFDPRRPAA